MNLQLKLFSGEEFRHDVESDIVTVGRSSKCDVIIPFIGVSRQHFQIEVKDGEIFITDLGSTNGVYIDGEKIEPHRKIPYKTFLNLSFGYVQSMHINVESIEEKDEDDSAMSDFTISKSFKSTPVVSNTRTKTQKLNKSSAKAKKAPPTKEENNIAFGNLIALLILGLALVWYSMKEEEVTPSYTPSSSVNTSAKDFEQF